MQVGSYQSQKSSGAGYPAMQPYQRLMPDSHFSLEEVFCFIIMVLRDRKRMAPGGVMLDFYRLPGGPYGYALPANITLRCNCQDGAIEQTTVYSGYPPLFGRFPLQEAEERIKGYLSMADFERVSYLDVSGFKQPIATKRQLMVCPGQCVG